MKCVICANEHDHKCPYIKAYEYYPETDADGHAIVKRVEFVSIADYFQREPDLVTLPEHATRQ